MGYVMPDKIAKLIMKLIRCQALRTVCLIAIGCSQNNVHSQSFFLVGPSTGFTEGTGHWNLIPNGNFETGSLDPWYPESDPARLVQYELNSTTPIYGNYSAKMTSPFAFLGSEWGGNGVGFDQNVSALLQGGRTYVVSGFIQRSPGATGRAYFDLHDAPFEVNGFATNGTTSVQFIYGFFTPPENVLVSVRLVMDGNVSAGEFVVTDEIAITPIDAFVPPNWTSVPEPEYYAAFTGLSLIAFAAYKRFKRNVIR